MSVTTASHTPLGDTPSLIQTNGKRKRVNSPEDNKGFIDLSESENKQCDEFYALLKDILVVLKSHDTTPSVLNRSLHSTIEQDHAAKRTKLTNPTTDFTVASQIDSNAYATVEELVADVDKAVCAVISDLSENRDLSESQAFPANARQIQAEIVRATALQKELDSIILREKLQRPKLLQTGTEYVPNLHKDAVGGKRTKDPNRSIGDTNTGRNVLTLFGGAPQPKQLFSSLQQPIPVKSEQPEISSLEKSIAVYAPLRDLALPNGISTTRIIPIHSTSSGDGKKGVPTIGELFAPPPTLAPLNPPRQSRHTATRSSSVNWFNASEAPSSGKSHRKESYTTQPLTTPQWLTYNVAPPRKELSSPEAKRKQRDRALSIGESQSTLSEEAVAEHQQAKEDALFRSVYSSFAPDRDNAAALVSERAKNRIWWKRIGESRYQVLSAFPNAEAFDSDANITTGDDGIDEDVLFKEAVDDWVPEDLPTEMKGQGDDSTQTPEAAKEVEEILQGISELLETLNSYQRVRNLSLSGNARAISGQNSQFSATTASPTNPSDAEFDVYKLLKSQLAVMVQMLPPYALAKLNGEQLGILNVNTKIQIEGKNYKGSMEEDEVTSKAKLGASAAYAARSLNASTSLPARSSGYHQTTAPMPVPRSNYASQPTAQRPATGSTAYLPNQQYSSRPPSANHYFSGNSRSSYSQPRPTPSASERYSYSTSQHYGAQPSQNPHSQYSNGYRQYPATNGNSYSQQYSTPQHGNSSVPAQGSQQRPSQPGYQQRAMNSQGYGYTPTTSARSASPPKVASAYSPPHQQQSTYSTQGSTPNQQRPPLYHQNSSHHGGQTPTPTQTNGTNIGGSETQRTYMTANEQATLMNRQKAQLAEQQTPPVRQGSGTPQPASGAQHNGTVAVQQNGVMAGQGQ